MALWGVGLVSPDTDFRLKLATLGRESALDACALLCAPYRPHVIPGMVVVSNDALGGVGLVWYHIYLRGLNVTWV